MTIKTKLSLSKQLKIKTLDLLFRPEKGKYFPIRNAEISKHVTSLRLEVPKEYYGQLIKEITAIKTADNVFLNAKKIRTLKELGTELLYPIEFEAEFAWAKNIIELNIPEISKFITLSRKYSDYLLSGDYTNASEILNEIEKKFGHSIWLMKNRVAFLQLTEGLEVQKRFVQNVKVDLRNGGLPRFLLHWTSVRNEEQTSVSRYSSQIDDTISKFHPTKQIGFDFYVKYHLLGIEPLDPDEFIHILRISYSDSLIDYYESFIALLRLLIINNNPKIVAKVYHYLYKEKTAIDPRIDFFRELFQINSPIHRSQSLENLVFEKILIGNNELATSLILEQAPADPSNPILILAQAQIKALTGKIHNIQSIAEDSGEFANLDLRSSLIEKLSKVIKEGIIKASKEYNELNKLALNFYGFPWVATIFHTFANEDFLSSNNANKNSLIPLKTEICHPIFLMHLPKSVFKDGYIQLCDVSYENSKVLDYQHSLLEGLPGKTCHGLDSIFSNYLGAVINYKGGRFDESISYCKNLIDSSAGFYQRRGFGLISRCYIKTNDLEDACTTIGTCYIKHREYVRFLPLEELCQIIKPGTSEWKSVYKLIDLSILCDAFVKHIGDGMETQRRFAYEDFLSNLGIEKPSELKLFINEIDKDKLVYYLYIICIESNMDTSGAFASGSQEVIEERLAICRMLTEIDPENSLIYRMEIKELVRKIVINNRRQEVDQSRIYVDIQSVKEKAEIELKENYERYKAYLKYDLKSFTSNDKKREKGIPTSAISIPDDELLELLAYLVEEVTKFYLSTDIGLDRFISTRIRHGELERSMRGPIQKYNLITKRKVKNGPYIRNDFWLKELIAPTEKISEVRNAFTRFSESYDKLIGIITNEWLQIKRNDRTYGLFDFDLHTTELEIIAEQINEQTTLAEFIDILISHLDNKLIYNLLIIRDKLFNVGKFEGKALLNKLLEDVNSILPQGINNLNAAVSQARTDFGAQFDKIVEWFAPSYSGNSSPYTVEDAVMVAEAIVKEGYPAFKVNVESEEDNEFLIHGKLPIFMDVFINIFENVIKRSGLEFPEANVQIQINDNENNIRVISCSVSNAVADISGIATIAADLRRKKTLLETESYHDYLAREGDSGLFKIYKSVRDFHVKDSAIEPTVNFGIENNRFDITITVPFNIYTLADDETI